MRHVCWGVCVMIMLSSCGLSKDVVYKATQDLKLERLEKDGVVIVSGNALLHNPKGIRARLTDMECQVYLEGKPMGDVVHTENIKVPKRSDFLLPFEVRIPLSKLLDNAASLAGSLWNDGKINMRIKGVAHVKSAGVKRKIPFEHQEEQKLIER